MNFADGQRRTCRLQIFCLPSANEKFADCKCLAGRRQISYRINGKSEFCRWHFSMQQASDQTAFHSGKSVQVVLAIVAAAPVAVPGCTEAAALRPLKSINMHPYFDSL